MDDEPYVCKPGYVLMQCPVCEYTNEVQEHASPQQVEAMCERCNLPDVEAALHPLSDKQVDDIVVRSILDARNRAVEVAGDATEVSFAEIGTMIAVNAMTNTFGALFAEEEYRRAYELVAVRRSGDPVDGDDQPSADGRRDPDGVREGDGVLVEEDRGESDRDGDRADGAPD